MKLTSLVLPALIAWSVEAAPIGTNLEVSRPIQSLAREMWFLTLEYTRDALLRMLTSRGMPMAPTRTGFAVLRSKTSA